MANEVTEGSGFGAAVTPESWATFVLEHLSAESVVLQAGARRVPTDSKVLNLPRLTTDATVAWLDELDEIQTDAPQGDELVLTPRKVAALLVLSNEAVDDSSPSVLEASGASMLRAIALEVDRALLHGVGDLQPLGVLEGQNYDDLAANIVDGPVSYESLVVAAGRVREAGGKPNAALIAPADHTALQLATDGLDRPLISPSGDTTAGPSQSVAGLTLYPTPALAEGEAVVAQADQIVVATRKDASVETSRDFAFANDATAARVTVRVDVGIGDPAGIAVIETGS